MSNLCTLLPTYTCTFYMCMYKQGQTNNKAKQHSTPKAVTFPKKNELPQVGLEPTTLYTLDRVLYSTTEIHVLTVQASSEFRHFRRKPRERISSFARRFLNRPEVPETQLYREPPDAYLEADFLEVHCIYMYTVHQHVYCTATGVCTLYVMIINFV